MSILLVEHVAVVVLDGEELPTSICLTKHRFAHQPGSSLLLQEDHVEDHLVLALSLVFRLCSLLKIFNIIRCVEGLSVNTNMANLKRLWLVTLAIHKLLMVHTLME